MGRDGSASGHYPGERKPKGVPTHVRVPIGVKFMVFPRKKGNEPSGPVERTRELYELAVRNLEYATSLARAGPPQTGTGVPLELTRLQLT